MTFIADIYILYWLIGIDCLIDSLIVVPLLMYVLCIGNTWIRLLTEYSTGYYTGSIYNRDIVLDRDFIGERQCSLAVSAIKAHPQDILWRQNRHGKFYVTFKDRASRLKCNGGGAHDFRRAVFIARNPYGCILSEYHRTVMSTTRGNSHQMAVTMERFNRTEWTYFAIQAAKEYNEIWTTMLQNLLSSRDFVSKQIRYEDLLNKQTRGNVLTDAIRFINHDKDGSCLGQYHKTIISSETDSQFNQRLSCAFKLADTRRTHRYAAVAAAAGPSGGMLNPADQPVTASVVYEEDPELVSKMWIYLKDYATVFGYNYTK